MAEELTIACPICAEPLRFTVCTNKNGKRSIGVHCPKDGRHFRGFVNHRPFVEEALTRMLEAVEERQVGEVAPVAAEQALQNDFEPPRPKRAAQKARPA